MIYNMVKELRHGQMDHDTKETMVMEENMVLEHTSGMMDHSIQEIGKRTKYQELVFIHG